MFIIFYQDGSALPDAMKNLNTSNVSDNEPYSDQIEACRHCDGEPSKNNADLPARCLLCERYFGKGRLFLNNVG